MRVVYSLLILFLLTGPVFAATNNSAFLKSQVACGEKAQDFLNQGNAGKAVALLAEGVKRFPDSDWLLKIGRAHV